MTKQMRCCWTVTSLLTPRRRIVQWGLFLTFLLLPFARRGGESLLRIDIPQLTLFFFGARLPVEELYLLGLLLFCLLFLLLLVTMVLGRAWCGWLCPQTALADLFEALARRLGLKTSLQTVHGPWPRLFLLHGSSALLSLLGGAALIWYFVSPYEYFVRLGSGHLTGWPLWASLVLALTIYLSMTLLRRLACRDFCPYGRFQTVLTERGTLTLGLDPDEADRCLNCLACLRACPMEIDIRQGGQIAVTNHRGNSKRVANHKTSGHRVPQMRDIGLRAGKRPRRETPIHMVREQVDNKADVVPCDRLQIACINCALCLDACRRVMAHQQQPGLIAYRFGAGKAGWRALLTPRLALVVGALMFFCLTLGLAIYHRPQASLIVLRNQTAAARLSRDGSSTVFFTAYLSNRDHSAHLYQLSAGTPSGALPLKGQTERISLAPGKRGILRFAAILAPSDPAQKMAITFTAIDEMGARPATVTVVVKRNENP